MADRWSNTLHRALDKTPKDHPMPLKLPLHYNTPPCNFTMGHNFVIDSFRFVLDKVFFDILNALERRMNYFWYLL